MNHYSISEAKLKISDIVELLENEIEEYIVINKYNKPLLKATLFSDTDRSSLFGAGENQFEIPSDFDDIDIASDFDCIA